MNKYETVIITNNNITQEQRNKTIKKITNLITENGNIIEIQNIGPRKLAYTINKMDTAYYHIIEFETKPELISELERQYRLSDDILKFITVRKDGNYE